MSSNKSPLSCLLLLLMSLQPLIACSQSWVTTCPGKQFCFDHPSSLAPVSAQMIDSTAGRLTNEQLELVYDFGRYSSDFSALTPTRVEAIDLQGHAAEILYAGNIMALRARKLRPVPGLGGYMSLAIQLNFQGDVDLELAERILRSVRILPAPN